MKSYLDRFEYLRSSEPSLRFSMVTLTVKNGDDLLERFTHLKNGVSALLKRRNHAIKGRRVQTEWAKVRGLVGSYEVTNKGNGWHPHVHMIALHSERLDYSAMIDEWRRITGDSYILHVDEARNPHDPVEDFLEVFKYALKFSDLSPELNFEAYRVLSGRRLLFSAGRSVVLLYRKTCSMSSSMTCPMLSCSIGMSVAGTTSSSTTASRLVTNVANEPFVTNATCVR